jgi:predicted sulfurtransferase
MVTECSPLVCVCAQVRTEAARSRAHRPLPPVPAEAADAVSLVLFYQYVEPQWSRREHKEALKYIINLGKSCQVTGRGRCAAEGLNCTLTGPPTAIRAFCNGLRAWRPALFDETDFKITDGLAQEHAFKALTIAKKADLVAYGLPSEVAPALCTSQVP